MAIIENGCTIIKMPKKEENEMKYICQDKKTGVYQIFKSYNGRSHCIARRRNLEDAKAFRDEMVKQIEQGTFLEWRESIRPKKQQ